MWQVRQLTDQLISFRMIQAQMAIENQQRSHYEV